jgi:hypothetical protein
MNILEADELLRHLTARRPQRLSAQRIVVVLGEDDDGQSLELSIYLGQSQADPGKLRIAALPESRDDDPFTLMRELIVQELRIPQGLVENVRLLSVKNRMVPKPRPIHEEWPPTSL